MTEKPKEPPSEDVALQKMKAESEAMAKIVKILEQVEANKRWKIMKAVAILLDVDLDGR